MVCGLLATPTRAMAFELPQPISPADGGLVRVDPTHGVTLTFSTPYGTSLKSFVEVSENRAILEEEGPFPNPTALIFVGHPTSEPSVESAEVGAVWFAPRSDALPAGEPVYWRPFTISCEPGGPENCRRGGVIWSLQFEAESAPPKPSAPATQIPACEAAEERLRRDLHLWAVTERQGAMGRAAKARRRRQIRQRALAVKKAERQEIEVCGS